jgi:DNA-directed RNA polymerase specialized sigma24 family protein
MGSIDLSESHGLQARKRREGSLRRLRAPWHRGAWSTGEVALALQAQRAELLRALRARADARGVPGDVLEEIVNEAVCIVVMMRRPIVSEEHLMGAFWTTVRLLLRHYREGRHALRVGSRLRVGFDAVAVHAAVRDPGPDEVAELKDRVARAADFVAQLSELEREVVAVMAVRGTGTKLTARIIGVPEKTVRAAARSARDKLDRIAVIASAGRMCDYREGAVVAYASGAGGGEDERLARAHLAACAPCRSAYARMVREMRSREFQGGSAAAFLPAPLAPLGHHLGLLGRMLGATAGRTVPGGGPGERAAEVLGGAGVVKVAAAGGAVVVATATLATGIHTLVMPSVRHAPHVHRHARMAVRHRVIQRGGGSVPANASDVAAQPSASAVRRVGSAHLTPQEHAELEFSSPPSASSNTSSRSARAPTASAASAHASSASSVAGLERSESSATGGGSSGASGPSQAAREFGQP